jgi:holliday junction DNA helicase RuvA
MIGWLRGTVLERDAISGQILLDVSGVGYMLTVSWQTFVCVPDPPETATLFVHTHVREDVLALFGFATPHERRMFQLLISVPQVGPRAAIGVLGGFPLTELLEAIAGAERGLLERIPGVGKRTAERIILDLREKVEPLRDALRDRDRDGTPRVASDRHDHGDQALRDDARAVLVNLGWKPKPVDAALDRAVADAPVADGTPDLDSLVRRALAILMDR